jgi:hypothetical protein
MQEYYLQKKLRTFVDESKQSCWTVIAVFADSVRVRACAPCFFESSQLTPCEPTQVVTRYPIKLVPAVVCVSCFACVLHASLTVRTCLFSALRNVALAQAETPYVLMADADFMPSPDFPVRQACRALCVCLSVCLHVCLSVCLPVRLCLSAYVRVLTFRSQELAMTAWQAAVRDLNVSPLWPLSLPLPPPPSLSLPLSPSLTHTDTHTHSGTPELPART